MTTGIYPKMAALAQCLCELLIAEGRDVCFCGVVPGEAVIDEMYECTETACGLAWVRLVVAQPTTGIGVITDTVNNCGSEIGFQVEVGVMRCIATSDELGSPPTEAEYLAAAQQQIEDLQTMQEAIDCCADLGDRILDSYTPVGPAGMSVGGFWTVTLGES